MVKTRYVSGILTALSMSLLFGCGGSSGSGGSDQTSTGKSLQIEGDFDTGTLLSTKPLFGVDLGLAALPAGTWKVRCIPSSGPNVAGEGTVNSEGGFAVVMNGVSPTAAIGCFLIHDDLFFASLVFGQTQNLSNQNVSVMSIFPGEDTKVLKLGTNITLAAGQIVLTPADFDYGTTPPTPTDTMGDLTGTWKVAKVYSGGGFTHPCDMESTQVERDACRAGWQTSAPMYMNMIKLNKGADARYTLSLWENSAHFNACGKSDALTHNVAWTIDNGSVNGATAKDAFPLHMPALNNLGETGDTVLADAKFLFYSRQLGGNWQHNCPLINPMIDPSTDPANLALCQAAT
ncbi:MAG TPA: hypothetical protein PL182_03645, partial [Pseudobdellovibrionaceae bacterium]|nr:hypothetical protein [Pseudobdellovibrionaceae bacterium]